MSALIERFAQLLGDRYHDRLEEDPEMISDGMLLHFDTGLTMEVVVVSPGECTYKWQWSEPEWAMETNIRGMDLTSFAEANGTSVSSIGGSLSEPTRATWQELVGVLDALFRTSATKR